MRSHDRDPFEWCLTRPVPANNSWILTGQDSTALEWILLAKVYRFSSLTRLDSTISRGGPIQPMIRDLGRSPTTRGKTYRAPSLTKSSNLSSRTLRLWKLQRNTDDVISQIRVADENSKWLIQNNNNLFLLI